ncbi:MAG TPA: tRNA uridine(34) 5-carboxymethylaminomethyl modification radical SAM/GNAT enzyme Elp3 [Candidatus Magasanikbacteria bacterium]|nr:tRNA uridine(34) 5-carboxymethylaminomethyl modification radical SAM/GNAT enzyme Elp3 [Candidatus Magasanikbacteria bacterium]
MLSELIKKLLQEKELTREKIDSLKRLYANEHKAVFPTTAELLKEYRRLLKLKKIQSSSTLEKILQKRSVRTLSGVAIVTVLTKPWPCPGKCIYCPLEKEMPKSYLKNEPAAQRAYFNNFNPYNQVFSRLKMLYNNGHPTDKVELIVKGGSWNSYSWSYQRWFIKECFRACNNFPQQTKPKLNLGSDQDLLKQQKTNEKAGSRIVGLTLETRPDLITLKTITQMRLLGCTRIELGVQHTDDKILNLTKRGHTLEQAKQAARLLRRYGFKLDFHLMPQLPGTTPTKDYQMIKQIFSDPDLKPDMIKIYPCSVVKHSELYTWFKKGLFKPYADKKLIEMLIKVKSQLIPRYCRISRLIRDIPATEIIAGNKVTNLRETIQKTMKRKGLLCSCLRCREIGHHPELKNKTLPLKIFIDQYSASKGQEYFLSFEDAKRQTVYGFCRLRIDPEGFFPAFIRELHVYGQLVEIGRQQKDASQHLGLGKKLIAAAEKICRENDVKQLAIISGVGVRGYYKKLGYHLQKTYLVKKID